MSAFLSHSVLSEDVSSLFIACGKVSCCAIMYTFVYIYRKKLLLVWFLLFLFCFFGGGIRSVVTELLLCGTSRLVFPL